VAVDGVIEDDTLIGINAVHQVLQVVNAPRIGGGRFWVGVKSNLVPESTLPDRVTNTKTKSYS
jgi:hypothetical protein